MRKPCELCNKVKAQAHHEDYSKPLEVIWLCQKHHAELHNNRRKVEEANLLCNLPQGGKD